MILLLSLLGVVLLLAGLFGTIAIAEKGDQNYSSSTKGNITRLTLMYVALFVLLVIGFFVYLN